MYVHFPCHFKNGLVLLTYKGADDIKNIVIFYCGCCGHCTVFSIEGKTLYFVTSARKNAFF